MGSQISLEMTGEMSKLMSEYFICISVTLFEALEILPQIFLTQWNMPHFVYCVFFYLICKDLILKAIYKKRKKCSCFMANFALSPSPCLLCSCHWT